MNPVISDLFVFNKPPSQQLTDAMVYSFSVAAIIAILWGFYKLIDYIKTKNKR